MTELKVLDQLLNVFYLWCSQPAAAPAASTLIPIFLPQI